MAETVTTLRTDEDVRAELARVRQDHRDVYDAWRATIEKAFPSLTAEGVTNYMILRLRTLR